MSEERILWLVVGYVAGSIPFGPILARLFGAGDLRRIGSGNIGATNVLRTGRYGLAAATLVLDALKGGLPAWLAARWGDPALGAWTGFSAVLGHCFPVWLRFRGGRGVATAAGVLLALTPAVAVVTAGAFLAVVSTTRYVSLGSLTGALIAPLFTFAFGDARVGYAYVAVAAVVVLRHADNIARLLGGRENRLSFGGRRDEEDGDGHGG